MAASVVTVSLRNMKFNEHKIKASHYAGQLGEWIRTQREFNWGGELCNGCLNPTIFTQIVSQQGVQTIFCFNTSPIPTWGSLDVCPDYGLDSIFKREVIFTSTPVSGYVGQVDAVITVSWLELGQLRSVNTNTTFYVLE